MFNPGVRDATIAEARQDRNPVTKTRRRLLEPCARFGPLFAGARWPDRAPLLYALLYNAQDQTLSRGEGCRRYEPIDVPAAISERSE